MIDDWRLGGDFEMGGRPRRRAGVFEDLECESRRFKHGFGGHLAAVPDPGAIVEGDHTRPDTHPEERTMIRFLFAYVPRALGPPRRFSRPPDLGILLLQILECLKPLFERQTAQ